MCRLEASRAAGRRCTAGILVRMKEPSGLREPIRRTSLSLRSVLRRVSAALPSVPCLRILDGPLGASTISETMPAQLSFRSGAPFDPSFGSPESAVLYRTTRPLPAFCSMASASVRPRRRRTPLLVACPSQTPVRRASVGRARGRAPVFRVCLGPKARYGGPIQPCSFARLSFSPCPEGEATPR